MTECTRREWAGRLLGGLAAALPAALHAADKSAPRYREASIRNVTLGVHSASFAESKLDEMLESLKAMGVGACELWSGHVEPKEFAGERAIREQLRRWRLSTPLDYFTTIRGKFDAAGIRLLAYNVELASDFTEAELERAFLVAEVMGMSCITSPGGAELIPRVSAFAREHRVRLAIVNRVEAGSDALVTAEEVNAALAGKRPEIGLALDLGAAAAAGLDGAAMLTQLGNRTFVVHLSDRKRGQTQAVACGTGDAAISAALRVLRDRRWPIPAMVDVRRRGQDAADDVKRCLDYCRQALEG